MMFKKKWKEKKTSDLSVRIALEQNLMFKGEILIKDRKFLYKSVE